MFCENINCKYGWNLTKHHLVPIQWRQAKSFLHPDKQAKMVLCSVCHKMVHKLKTNEELAKEYSTREKIIELLSSQTLQYT